MTKYSPSTVLLALSALFALSGYNCNDVLDDPGFDLWCGDQLCTWQQESGQVARVETWHPSDYGVELVGADVAISQLATRNDFSCLRFELIADIEETAEVTLELDFFNDGRIEYAQRIPTAHWQELSYQIRMPYSFDDLLFRIRKRGGGRAVLAEIAALSEGDCQGLAPIAQYEGALCSGDGACASGVCVDSFPFETCGQCAGAGDCTGGQICGLETSVASPYLWPFAACVDPASHGLGERCLDDAECATGMCVDEVCSTCRDAGECAANQACAKRADALGRTWSLPPSQCEPAAMGAPSGTACLTDSDCQSQVCLGTGERRLCLVDSRACTGDTDCPSEAIGGAGDSAVCATVGLADGFCQ